MLHSVWTKSLADQRRSLLVWAIALILLVGMYAAFYPSFRGSTNYSDLINQMPKALRDLFTAGAGGDLSSGPGFVYMELLSFMAPTLLLIYAIGAGAQSIAGEEDARTIELLMATPITRRRLLLDKFLALVVGTTLLATVMGGAVVAFGAVTDMGLSVINVVASMTHLVLLALVFGAVAVLIGATTGNVALARAIPAGLAVAAYLLNGFGASVSWLASARRLSPFYQYVGHDPIRHGFSAISLLVATATCAVLIAAAVPLFARRDVRA